MEREMDALTIHYSLRYGNESASDLLCLQLQRSGKNKNKKKLVGEKKFQFANVF